MAYLLETARKITLVTGPARSGKSAWAEKLARRTQLPVTYIATAAIAPADPEWQARLERHRRRRPASWQLLEVPQQLPEAIAQAPPGCLLVDSLGTWVANCLERADQDWEAFTEQLLKNLQASPNQLILVAEETGWGVVPPYPSGRQFRDRLGELTQQIGAIADEVYLAIAGRAVNLAALGQPLQDLS